MKMGKTYSIFKFQTELVLHKTFFIINWNPISNMRKSCYATTHSVKCQSQKTVQRMVLQKIIEFYTNYIFVGTYIKKFFRNLHRLRKVAIWRNDVAWKSHITVSIHCLSCHA